MQAKDVPPGKNVFYADGRAFYYELGHRIYVEGVEVPPNAHLKATAAQRDRVILTCGKCGSWYDSPIGCGPSGCADPDVYNGNFFSKFHVKCGGGVYNKPYHSSEAPERPPGTPWDPTSCPDFVPHSKAYLRHGTDRQKLIGTWRLCQVGMLRFDPAGGGDCLDMAKIDPEFAFNWRINENGNLVLETEERHLAIGRLRRLFTPDGIRFELVTFTEPYGKPENYLLLWPPERNALEFRSVITSPPGSSDPEWTIEKYQDGTEISRLSASYIARLFRDALNVRIMAMAQMTSVRQAWERRAHSNVASESITKFVEGGAAPESLLKIIKGDALWVLLAGLIPGVLSHLKLAEGNRLACLFGSNDSLHTFSGWTRIIMIESNRAGSPEAPPPELHDVNLNEASPTGLPCWVTWSPCDAINDDGTPASVFERFLLDEWLTKLLTFGPTLFFEGIVAGNECCLFPDTTLSLPEQLSFSGNVRPLIAFVSAANVPAAFLPAKAKGRKVISGKKFAYLELYSCRRSFGNFSHAQPGTKIEATSRIRAWYRAGKRIWLENDQQAKFGNPFLSF